MGIFGFFRAAGHPSRSTHCSHSHTIYSYFGHKSLTSVACAIHQCPPFHHPIVPSLSHSKLKVYKRPFRGLNPRCFFPSATFSSIPRVLLGYVFTCWRTLFALLLCVCFLSFQNLIFIYGFVVFFFLVFFPRLILVRFISRWAFFGFDLLR